MSAGALRRALKKHFDLDDFRPGQEEVIRRVLAGRDTLAIMPTGAGKSLCYQLPALLLPGTTVVVSPLIALMNDQADKLASAGVDTSRVNSTLSRDDHVDALARIASRRSEIVFVTPERLGNPEVLERLAQNHIDLLVIDEAHCVSQWGHDFRPAFLEIADALPRLGNPPLLALTATANEEVVDDIRKSLHRPEMRAFYASVYRPNLVYAVRQVTGSLDRIDALAGVLTEVEGPRIVYTVTVRAAEEVQRALAERGFDPLLYHGRMRAAERADNQQRFMSQGDALMVATNAFGLGIDKPDVRAVVHYQLPASLEAYYQESGRAGRDGEPGWCTLLLDTADRRIHRFFQANRYPSAADLDRLWQAVVACGDESPASVDDILAHVDGLARTKARVGLKLLAEAGALRPTRGARYTARARGASDEAVQRLAERYLMRAERDREKLDSVVSYGHSARCRWRTLLEYFDETPAWENCGRCDNCTNPPGLSATQHSESGRNCRAL